MKYKFKGFSSTLVENAEFDGKFELPTIYQEKEKIIPVDMIPFDKRNKYKEKIDLFVHFFIYDEKFVQLLNKPDKYIEELRSFRGVISPDFSLYRDMPYLEQASNTYINRSLGHYMQSQGLYVIPNVRWSERRSFDYCFDGLESGGIYCISTHGCIKSKEDRYYFKQGLDELIKRLEPKTILVYGAMPKNVFGNYLDTVEFIHYPSYTSRVFAGGVYGNRD